ncbi:hypothetical protein PC510_003822 [Escherichia coli]|uniref:hypothetical protein n=1 Tax=Escherichia coli TaxID=562 RepID=UPI000A19FB44|nr:hypothetical protein [Escherichia coli]EFH8163228.1 hypothetical protein [Escherichia coli]EKI3096546.1 hypothetical protein [Escherichia coli]EKR4921432.1 hypothetical protein [Escherichia coli]ELM8776602.1 hypothetical protein [Escherichia coli]EMA4402814.1 hypothetical protein [Escherichia coli]
MASKNNQFLTRDYVGKKHQKATKIRKSTALGIIARLVFLAPVIFGAVFLMVIVFEKSSGF